MLKNNKVNEVKFFSFVISFNVFGIKKNIFVTFLGMFSIVFSVEYGYIIGYFSAH